MMRRVLALIVGLVALAAAAMAADSPGEDQEGAMHVPAITLPESSFLGKETRAELKKSRDRDKQEAGADKCAAIEKATRAEAPAIRKCEVDAFYQSASYKRLRALFHVSMTPQKIGGIYTEVFMPAEGVPPKNLNRVLINVHGGGFVGGARTGSYIESAPIAALGKFKVISIDYRQAPEYAFPAASEDVTAVYRQLLEAYQPKNIGIYGCSAGGLLSAETIAWLQRAKLPLPGAVGMFCEGAGYWTEGDAGYVGRTLSGGPVWGVPHDNPYFKNAKTDDPLAFPIRSHAVMAKFPPSLLITSIRDPALSSVVHTHSVLVAAGVDAELHVWEGLEHAFLYDPDLPQSREAYAVAVKFFDVHLGI